MLRGFSDGIYPPGVDLRSRTRRRVADPQHQLRSVLHEEDAVLCTFRDVTQGRQTAIRAEQTKEFLERVIDSSVDGIVSANLKGTVLLFNRAPRHFRLLAERRRGQNARRAPVPQGVAHDIMRKIRDPSERLRTPRRLSRRMLGSDGAQIPVTLSASLVLDNGLHRQRRYLHRYPRATALQKAGTGSRRAAGSRAHGDRGGVGRRGRARAQPPLTSVIGYAELPVASSTMTRSYRRGAVIIRESERMAEIVRRSKDHQIRDQELRGRREDPRPEKASGTEPGPRTSDMSRRPDSLEPPPERSPPEDRDTRPAPSGTGARRRPRSQSRGATCCSGSRRACPSMSPVKTWGAGSWTAWAAVPRRRARHLPGPAGRAEPVVRSIGDGVHRGPERDPSRLFRLTPKSASTSSTTAAAPRARLHVARDDAHEPLSHCAAKWPQRRRFGCRPRACALRARRRVGTQLSSLQAQVIQTEKLASLGQIVAGVVHELNNRSPRSSPTPTT